MSTAASPSVSSLVEQCGPIVVMGVSGCGKSSVGAQLADQLGAVSYTHLTLPTTSRV